MNETAPLQKQDLNHICYTLDEIARSLNRIEILLEELCVKAKSPTDTGEVG